MSTTAILRTYNNDRTFQVIEQLAKPEYDIGHFNVVIHAAEERKKNYDSVARLRDSQHASRITPIPIEPYGWSRALNAGIEALPQESNLVLMISNEVSLSPEQLKSIKQRAKESDSSGGYALFKGPEGISLNYLTYNMPRNTCFGWNRKVFEEVGNFNLATDKLGGMEDVELMLRAFIYGGLIPKLAAREVPLEIRQGTNTGEKTSKEMETIRLFESVYHLSKVREFYQRLGLSEQRKAAGY